MGPLNLNTVADRGRQAQSLEHALIGPLAPADIALLDTPRPQSAAPPIQQIRARHHQIARLVAEGRSHIEISAILGNITPQRLTQLSDDPAFKELVSFYINAQGATFIDAQARMSALMVDTVEELQERMADDEKRAELSHGTLLQQLELLADRTGHGRQTKSTNVNVNVGLAGRLEEARRRIASNVIEGKVE